MSQMEIKAGFRVIFLAGKAQFLIYSTTQYDSGRAGYITKIIPAKPRRDF